MKTIRKKKCKDLVETEYNPRYLSEKKEETIRQSLQTFGFITPIVVNINPNRKNVVVGGHQRLRIWREMGEDTIPCIEVDLTEEEERELNIRLNQSGEWDYEVLTSEFDIDELTQWGFDLKELTGFAPDVAPSFGGQDVDSEDIDKAGDKLTTQFQGDPDEDLHEVICPYCGERYHVRV